MAKEPQMQITDETLMALADGELPAGQARLVQAAVDADPALQDRLRLFTETRRLLQADGAATTVSERDDALAARIRQSASAAPPPPAANMNRRPLAVLAASLAAAAIGLGWWWQADGPMTDLPSSHLAALTSLPSGETDELEDGQSLTLIASYRDPAGTFCREYETRSGTSMTIRIACKAGESWQARFAENVTASEGYVPATGEIASLDAFLSDAALGSPLSAEEERLALE